ECIINNRMVSAKDFNSEKILLQWIKTNEWEQIIESVQAGFLKLKTRQRSIFERFLNIFQYFSLSNNEQDLWQSYVVIQNYITANIEGKYNTHIRKMIQRFYI
ncbi:hypothetical protein CD153_13500, partial [Staphylococcus carnosus]